MSVRENSLQTYHEIKPKLSGRRAIVFDYICRNEPCTEREIKTGLNLPDMNSVRPRCTELIKSGVIEEEKTIRDSATRS